MGSRLFPAEQVKNMIRTMVKSGALSGEKVDAWRTKLADEEKVEQTRQRAEAGDGMAMHALGSWHEYGLNGLAQDSAKAIEWFSKSHEAGDASGTGTLGWRYLLGTGVRQCSVHGGALLGEAAALGSQEACYNLGQFYADGAHGFPKDRQLARRWFARVLSAAEKDLRPEYVDEAAAWVEAHPHVENEGGGGGTGGGTSGGRRPRPTAARDADVIIR